MASAEATQRVGDGGGRGPGRRRPPPEVRAIRVGRVLAVPLRLPRHRWADRGREAESRRALSATRGNDCGRPPVSATACRAGEAEAEAETGFEAGVRRWRRGRRARAQAVERGAGRAAGSADAAAIPRAVPAWLPPHVHHRQVRHPSLNPKTKKIKKKLKIKNGRPQRPVQQPPAQLGKASPTRNAVLCVALFSCLGVAVSSGWSSSCRCGAARAACRRGGPERTRPQRALS